MGSFCGQGSQNKVTETQTYNPSAGGIAALNNANYWLNTVNPANAPLLNVNAPNAGQTGAYQGFMDLVNQNPFAAYSTQAMNLYNQSTQRGDVDQYLNPYRDEALAAMKRYNFDPATRQAMGASRGASGGVGAARSGLTAANLAKSQADATTGALANYYQSAEQMAANQRMMQQAAAYGVGNLGTADVNQRLAGLSGELGAGNNLWQYQQAPNQALYNQQMLQFTTPFQLAGAYAGMAPAWGGTQTGEKNYPAPGILQQIAGLGMAGLGIYGGMGGKFSNPFAGWGGGGQARGGAIKHAALGGSMYSGLPQSGGFDPSFNPYQQLQTYFNNNFRRRAAQPMQAQSMQARPPVGNEIAQGAPQVPSGLPTSNPFMPTPTPTPQTGLPEVGNNPDMGTGLPIGTPQGSLGPSSMTPPMPTLSGGVRPSPVTGTAVLPGQNWINPIMGTPTGGVGGLISGTSPEQSNPFSMGIRGFADGGDTANEIDNELFGQEDLRQEGIDKLRSAMTPPARPPRSLNLSDENLISIAKEGDPDSKFDAIRAGGERGDLPSVVSDNFKPVFPETPGYASRNDEGLGAVGVDVPPVRSLPAIPSLGGAQAAGQGDTSTKLASNPWMALVQAGLGTMAASGERDARGLPLTGIAAIGKGGMKGVAELNQQREEARKDELAKYQAAMQQVPYTNLTAAQQLEALKPFKIGTDPNTFLDVYGIRDPRTGEIHRVDSQTGKIISSNNPIIPEQGLTGEKYLATLDPKMAGIVKAIDEGRQAPPSINSRSPQARAVLNHLYAYNPNGDMTLWKSRNETRAAFSKGTEGRAVTSLGTLMGHLTDFADTSDKLAQKNVKPWNKLENAIRDNLGGTALADYKVARTAVADELARVFQGTGVAAESEKQRWLDALDDARTPAQFRRVVGRLVSLTESRMHNLEAQHDRGMHYDQDHPESAVSNGFLDKISREKYEKLKQWSISEPEKKKKIAPAVAAPSPMAAPAPGTERGGYRFKGGDPSKKESWEKI